MATVKNYVAIPQFLIASTLYWLHHFFANASLQYAHSIVRFYFGDFLALIVCIPIFVNSQILFKVRKPSKIKKWEIVFYSALFSVYFEEIGPIFLQNFTGDFFDCVAYFAGGIVLYATQNIGKPAINQPSPLHQIRISIQRTAL